MLAPRPPATSDSSRIGGDGPLRLRMRAQACDASAPATLVSRMTRSYVAAARAARPSSTDLAATTAQPFRPARTSVVAGSFPRTRTRAGAPSSPSELAGWGEKLPGAILRRGRDLML